jgi:hypothetical protein
MTRLGTLAGHAKHNPPSDPARTPCDHGDYAVESPTYACMFERV